MFQNMIAKLKTENKTLVFTEGSDPRILEAASRLKKDAIVTPLLIGVKEEVDSVASKNHLDISGIEIIDPAKYSKMDELVSTMVLLRKGKMSEDECREKLLKNNYFGTMLVKIGLAHGLLGGATYSTADTVRPALQLVKTRPGNSIVSSCFILVRENNGKQEKIAMGDCAINITPNEDEIVEIALETAKTAKVFGIEPKVALLSFSTKGSGKGEMVEKMQNATAKLQAMNLDYPIDGELQFDAAVSETVAKTKCKGSLVAGHANTFIFPEIQSGNIGYKIAQRLGGFAAYGPILQGLNAPINDLSRGCDADEVYNMAIITASLS